MMYGAPATIRDVLALFIEMLGWKLASWLRGES